jgi:hypothetical protein
VEYFGALFNCDNFNLEKFIGELNRSRTATRNGGYQLGINFLLSHHADEAYDYSSFHPKIRDFLTKCGFNRSFFTTLGSFATQYSNDLMTEVELEELAHDTDGMGPADPGGIKRVTRMKHVCQILTSARYARVIEA